MALGHVPKTWKIARAVFTSKSRKLCRISVKAYRPISLTSIVLKTMETLVDRFIKDGVL